MELSVMTFSLLREWITGKANPQLLCEMAESAEIRALDLMDIELKLYGREKLKNAMAQAGLSCECLIATAPFFSNGGKVEAAIARALEAAKDMGAGILMLVPGGPTGAEKKACSRMSREQQQKLLVRYFRLAVRMAEAYGIQVCVENTPQRFKPLASQEDCLYLLSQVEGLGFIFDTANMKVANVNADELAFYEALKPYTRRIHLKDVVFGPFKSGEACSDGQMMRTVQAGSGVIRIRELLRAIAKDNFDGKLVVEYAVQADVRGKDHIENLRSACTWIRDVLRNEEILPPCMEIPGLSLPVPRIFFGTAIAPMLRGKNVNGLLDGIYAQGIYAFDTARGYGGAEKSLGTWIRERNNRDRIIILTKCGNVSLSGKVHVDSKVIRSELEASLKALGTGYIDIYLLHRDDPNTPVGEIIECLNEARRQGKIRVFGASNWTHERIAEANAYAEAHGLAGFTVSSPNFGLADQVGDPWGGDCVTISGPSNADARAWYTEQKMPVIAYSSLGRGFFSGRFKSGDFEGARKILDKPAQKGYLCEDNMERLHRAEILAEQKGRSVAQIAMSYIFSQTMPVFAIVSTTNPGRMHENIQAAQLRLTPEEVSWLENVGN